jgi:hypothetical protein
VLNVVNDAPIIINYIHHTLFYSNIITIIQCNDTTSTTTFIGNDDINKIGYAQEMYIARYLAYISTLVVLITTL